MLIFIIISEREDEQKKEECAQHICEVFIALDFTILDQITTFIYIHIAFD
jgi:hypothetical protein